MSFTIQVRQIRGIPVLDLNGTFTLGPSLANFEKQVTQLLTEMRPSQLLMDLQAIERMDSAGLGEIMILYSMAREAKCTLGLVGANAGVRQLLHMTRADGVLNLYEDEAAALAARTA
jgi:anti-sigma B factor antagonist